jgi:hypothetical protein
MTEKEIRDKLYDSTILIKLITGELLVAIIIAKNEYGVTIFLPFELKNSELLDYCDIYATDSKFDIYATNVLFIKTPTNAIKDEYFNFLMKDRENELRTFIMAMSLLKSVKPMHTTSSETDQESAPKTIH